MTYNFYVRTRTLAVALLLAVAVLAACNKKNASAKSSDPVEQKLQQLAGSGAKDCGHIKAAAQAEAKPASDCAMQEAQAKKPFYVAYDMPGLTVAVAGAPDGKLYAVQSQTQMTGNENSGSQPSGPPQITVNPCPSELRMASSGRVTCYSAGSFGAMGGANPHGGGMAMPPGGMMNPHGGSMPMPPAGTPNPHGASAMPSSHGSANKDNSSAQPASKK